MKPRTFGGSVGCLACLIALVFVFAASGSVAHGAENLSAKEKAAVAEKVKDVRERASQWGWIRAKVDLVFALIESVAQWDGDVFWKAPNLLSVLLRSDGNETVDLAYVWDGEGYFEYNVDGGEVNKVDVRALRKKFDAQAMSRSGLVQESDPFQGIDEQSLRLVGEEQLNDEKTLLFSGQLWPQYGEEETGKLKALLWIGKDDGLLRRCETYRENGKRLMSQTMTIVEKKRNAKELPKMPEINGDFSVKDETKEAEVWLREIYGNSGDKKEKKETRKP